MGDRLRDILGLAWTKEEIELYSQIASEKLGPAYLIEGIPKDQPSHRVRYLDKKLDIGDDEEIEKRILNIYKECNNKALTLKELEKIAIKRFF